MEFSVPAGWYTVPFRKDFSKCPVVGLISYITLLVYSLSLHITLTALGRQLLLDALATGWRLHQQLVIDFSLSPTTTKGGQYG
jgi:hypothetical protein